MLHQKGTPHFFIFPNDRLNPPPPSHPPTAFPSEIRQARRDLCAAKHSPPKRGPNTRGQQRPLSETNRDRSAAPARYRSNSIFGAISARANLGGRGLCINQRAKKARPIMSPGKSPRRNSARAGAQSIGSRHICEPPRGHAQLNSISRNQPPNRA